MSDHLPDPRVLPLSNVHNFRDYGGYATQDGGRVKRGVLWRSGHHSEASDADLQAIEALALATVESILEKRGDDQIARLLADLEQMPDEAAHSLTR